MKKILLAFAVLLTATIAKADIFGNADDKSFVVNYSTAFAAGANNIPSTFTLLIDLSDTVNWPHKSTRELNITSVRVELDKAAASTCTLRLGVITGINASTGSVKWFYTKGNKVNASNTNVLDISPAQSLYYRLRVDPSTAPLTNLAGPTPYFLSIETTNDTTLLQSDIPLHSPIGLVRPGVGDLIMEFIAGTATVNVSLLINYFAK